MGQICKSSNLFVAENGMVKLENFNVQYSDKQKKIEAEICKIYQDAKIEMPQLSAILSQYPKNTDEAKQIISALIIKQMIIPLNDSFFMWKPFYDDVVEKSMARWKNKDPMSLADFRDFWQTSRKFALPILEYFDSKKITKKIDDVRKWL